MTYQECLEVAGAVWTIGPMRSNVMDVEAATKIADILFDLYGKGVKEA